MYCMHMIDSGRFEELRAIMGQDFAILIDQAVLDMQAPLATLARVCAGGAEQGEIGFALHTLYGIASNIGCTEICAHCTEGRKALDAGQFDASVAQVIMAEIEACRATLVCAVTDPAQKG